MRAAENILQKHSSQFTSTDSSPSCTFITQVGPLVSSQVPCEQ